MRPTSLLRVLLLVAVAALMVGCAPGGNPLAHTATSGAPAGFFLGLWHGFIIWVTFLVSLFDPSVSIYEVHNGGWTYNLGFAIGAACLHGSGGAAARRRRRSKGS
jgi:hydrogenase/urease accessory protein HupE